MLQVAYSYCTTISNDSSRYLACVLEYSDYGSRRMLYMPVIIILFNIKNAATMSFYAIIIDL